jgi:hypothetical protein
MLRSIAHFSSVWNLWRNILPEVLEKMDGTHAWT